MAMNVTDQPKLSPEILTNEPIFQLTYKAGPTIHSILHQAKDLEAAIVDGKAYCSAHQMRFITTSPAIQDIKKLTQKKLERTGV